MQQKFILFPFIFDRLFGVDHNMNLDYYLREIAFFDGTCYSCKTHCGKAINCTENFEYLVNNVSII